MLKCKRGLHALASVQGNHCFGEHRLGGRALAAEVKEKISISHSRLDLAGVGPGQQKGNTQINPWSRIQITLC